jgi:hypothetical protein|tara:strand:+ start:1945 stop:2397 length:453 start_codon:yes stop_codon:yes gene_type:complete
MTAPLGERPWQNPPRYSSVEETLQFYMPRITSQKMANQLMNILEMGVPIDTVVDTVQLGGVMEGVHSVDIGILISPVLAEVMEQMAIAADVDYVLEGNESDEETPDDSEIALAMMEAAKKTGLAIKEEEAVEEEAPIEEPQPKGLMARRA